MSIRLEQLFTALVIGLLFMGSTSESFMTIRTDHVRDVIDYQKEALLRNPHWDIWSVTVLDVSGGKVNGDPPVLRLNVDGVLRGHMKKKEVVAKWSPSVYHADISKSARPDENQMVEDWYFRPIKAPEPEDKLIVFSINRDDGAVTLQGGAVYRYSAENREAVINHMAPAERPLYIQGPIALLILALPIIGFIAFWRRNHNTDQQNGVKRLDVLIIAIPMVAIALYVYYESGISVYSNIRMDLLIIWPALIATFSLWLVLAIKYLSLKRSNRL